VILLANEVLRVSDLESNKGRSHSLSRHAALTAVSNFAVPATALLTAPLLARALGPDGRGELAAALAPINLFTALALLGLPEAVTYFAASRQQQRRQLERRAGTILALSGILATCIVIFLAPVLAGGSSSLALLINIGALSIIPSTLLGALRGGAASAHQWPRVNAERYITNLSKPLIYLALFMVGHLDLFAATVVVPVSILLGFIPYIWPVKEQQERDQRGDEQNPIPHKEILAFGGSVWIGALAGTVLASLDQLVFIPFGGSTTQLGFYAAAVSIGAVASLANNAIRDVTFSAESRASSPARIQTAARISLLVSMTVGVALVLSIPFWFVWVFGPSFAGATVVAQIMVVGAIAIVPGTIAGVGLRARGRPWLTSISMVSAAIVNIGFLITLIPSLGAVGAAIATLMGNLVASTMNVLFMKIYFGVPFLSFLAIRRRDFGRIFTFVKGFVAR
jgi:O-antigen/teichoic acid export membrane protein